MPRVSELAPPLTTFAFVQLHHPAPICCAAVFYRSLPHHAKDRERKTRSTRVREERARERERDTGREATARKGSSVRERQTSRNRHGETCIHRRYAAAPAAGTTSPNQTPSGRLRVSDTWAICRHSQRSRRQDHVTNAAFPNQTSALRRADIKGHSNLRHPLPQKQMSRSMRERPEPHTIEQAWPLLQHACAAGNAPCAPTAKTDV